MNPDWLPLASKGAPMPSELPPEEQLAYQALSHLYARYRLKAVSKATAAGDKVKILSAMRKASESRNLREKQGAQWVRMWRNADNGASEFRMAESVEEKLKAAEKMLKAIEGRDP